MVKKWQSFKDILAEQTKETVNDISYLKDKMSFNDLIDHLSKKAVQKRLLEEFRESKAIDLDYNELFKVCRLVYDGVVENTEVFQDKFTEIKDDMEFNDIGSLNDIFSPLGNMIIGNKTIKDYCNDFVTPQETHDIKESYDEAKTKINEKLGRFLDESGRWDVEIEHVAREHGVLPMTGKKTPILYNIKNIGIKYPELGHVIDEIIEYKSLYPDKEIMNFKGVKTAAFKKFLKEHK